MVHAPKGFYSASERKIPMTNVKVSRKDVPNEQEIQQEIAAANQIKNPYFRLRALATIALLETGKRRSELAALKIEKENPDIWTDSEYLYVRFTVRKKRKKSLRVLQRIKKFSLSSPYAQMILEYITYLKEKVKTDFVYPSGHNVFDNYVIDPAKPLKPQEIWRIVKALNPKDWPHLHRERRAVKVIRRDEKRFGSAKIETVYTIKNVLDLEREQTAWNYIRRHETQRVEEEDEILE